MIGNCKTFISKQRSKTNKRCNVGDVFCCALSDDENYYTVAFYHGDKEILVIPSEVSGLPVKEICRNAFKDCDMLQNVVIPDSVVEIGEMAFFGCNKMEEIKIPDSVVKIGEGAFGCCSGMKCVTIGSGVVSIDKSAFFGCDALETVYVNDIDKWNNIVFADDKANPMFYAKELCTCDC